ncbi:MAG: hypothetical protein D4R50_01305 [Actinomycetales bacterium]|nr:MAG: hypothetical protein D4R50_01305 [Actinomycetales bacterium]
MQGPLDSAKKSWDTLSKQVILDARISLRAKGLFAYYLEKGQVIAADEMSMIVPEGRDAIRKALRELRTNGYIIRCRYQDASGKWKTSLNFTDAWKTDT